MARTAAPRQTVPTRKPAAKRPKLIKCDSPQIKTKKKTEFDPAVLKRKIREKGGEILGTVEGTRRSLAKTPLPPKLLVKHESGHKAKSRKLIELPIAKRPRGKR